MDPTSFVPADVLTLRSTRRNRGYQFHWLNPQTLEVGFPAQGIAGSYRITLGSSVLDAAGNLLDQDGDLVPERQRRSVFVGLEIRAPRAESHTPSSPTAGR